MGFFKSIWKGIKSAVKSIGKGIKKAAKSVGKFMDKIGVVGQIALMFILPGVGGLISKGIGALAGAANPLLSGLGKVLQVAGKFANTVGNVFKTATDAVFGFVKNIGQGMINKAGSLLGRQELVFANGPASIGEGFKKWMGEVGNNASNITSPFTKAAEETNTAITSAYEDSFKAMEGNLDKVLSTPKSPTNPMSLEFDPNFKIPDFKPVREDSLFNVDLPKSGFESISLAEERGAKSFISNITDYVSSTVKELPKRVVDNAANAVTTLPQQLIESSLQETPQYTQVTNVIPQFNSTPMMTTAQSVDNAYGSQGFGYGATLSNRITFNAAQSMPYGDYGLGGYTNFAQKRVA